MAKVDPVEKHRQRGSVELDLRRTLSDTREAKTATFQSLVIDDEAAAIPEEDLHPIRAPAEEHEQVPRVRIVTELRPHRRAEPVVTTAEVDRRDGEEDSARRRRPQHAGCRARASAAT